MNRRFLPIMGIGILFFLLSGKKVGKMIRKEDVEKIKNYGKRNYNLAFDKPTLVGIRGALPDENGILRRNSNSINKWNDSLIVITKTNSYFFLGTIDPGRFYVESPMNSEGTAQLQPGLYEFTKGFHGFSKYGNKYPSFVPYSNLLIKRDGNKDSIWNHLDKNFTGKFGINIHAQFTEGEVEKNSAGCTVVKAKWNSPTWKQFYDLLKNEVKFKYMVVDGAEIV
ncbi:hypothetical protein [Leptospira biflexa]|uniref:hypothetical protein n=1 Tax=Leptospira biflexa TaxID=172 RepID=UPI0010827F71|nr:hypothetical protein [Leptospira biflexa]TGM32203.1 hypothetical protein EHQ80_18080 [Leptospira biflexa]TGM42180.1 hypothetical protein EHQ89_01310 [Leptospira biflexa]